MKKNISEEELKLFSENDITDILYSWALKQFSEHNKEHYSLAIKFYELAAEEGHIYALNNLGTLYSEGIFVEKDIEKAVEYYLKSAENGCSEACSNLGDFYLNEKSEEPDYKKAFEYFSRGAMLGNDANCFYKLGDMYMEGNYVEKNPALAFNFYEKALDMFGKFGCEYRKNIMPDIKYKMGKCLLEGIGVEADKIKANLYLNEALSEYQNHTHISYSLREKIKNVKLLLEECSLPFPILPDFKD